MSGLFVAGTDTECGKTAVTCALARNARLDGLRVRVIKPVETGCRVSGSRIEPLDALALARAAEDRSPLAEICPYPLRLPAAPEVAARAEGVSIDVTRIEKVVRQAQTEADCVLVEGVGGLLVPVCAGLEVADLVERLGLPLIVVARASLGTINHTRLTLEAAARRDLRLLGVIISHTTPDLPESERANLALLIEELGSLLLAELPHGQAIPAPRVNLRALLSQAGGC